MCGYIKSCKKRNKGTFNISIIKGREFEVEVEFEVGGGVGYNEEIENTPSLQQTMVELSVTAPMFE